MNIQLPMGTLRERKTSYKEGRQSKRFDCNGH